MSVCILVVDDLVLMCQMVLFVFILAGFIVEEVEDGVIVFGWVKGQCFNVVVIDVNMFNMDGILLICELCQLVDYKFMLMLMLIIELVVDKKFEGKVVGVIGWLVKLFNFEQLVVIVQKVFG